MNSKGLCRAINGVDDEILERSETTGKKKNRWLKWSALAACLCVALLMSFWGIPSPTNAFFVKAYALEPANDGTIELKETDLMEQSDIWGGHFDGKNFYLNVGLRYDGSNIRSVDFITEDGFFAKQYIGSLAVGENVSEMYVGPENKLVMYGTEFEIVGDMITLDDNTMTDDLLLFWGTQATEMSEIFNKHIEIKAIATFYDGRTQEVTTPIDLTGIGLFSSISTGEDIQRQKDEFDYYMNLPLEKCELLEETVETVTDVYEVNVGIGTDWITIRDNMEFDQDGIWRGGTRGGITDAGYEVYIPVIKRDMNGVYTGMIYRVPHNLHYTAE